MNAVEEVSCPQHAPRMPPERASECGLGQVGPGAAIDTAPPGPQEAEATTEHQAPWQSDFENQLDVSAAA